MPDERKRGRQIASDAGERPVARVSYSLCAACCTLLLLPERAEAQTTAQPIYIGCKQNGPARLCLHFVRWPPAQPLINLAADGRPRPDAGTCYPTF